MQQALGIVLVILTFGELNGHDENPSKSTEEDGGTLVRSKELQMVGHAGRVCSFWPIIQDAVCIGRISRACFSPWRDLRHWSSAAL